MAVEFILIIINKLNVNLYETKNNLFHNDHEKYCYKNKNSHEWLIKTIASNVQNIINAQKNYIYSNIQL